MKPGEHSHVRERGCVQGIALGVFVPSVLYFSMVKAKMPIRIEIDNELYERKKEIEGLLNIAELKIRDVKAEELLCNLTVTGSQQSLVFQFRRLFVVHVHQPLGAHAEGSSSLFFTLIVHFFVKSSMCQIATKLTTTCEQMVAFWELILVERTMRSLNGAPRT